MAGKSFIQYTVVPSRPYSLERTCSRLSRFEERADCYEDGTYRRLVHLGRKAAVIEVEQQGPPSRAKLLVRISDRAARDEAERILDRVLGARSAVVPFYRRFRDDTILGPLLSRHRGLRVVGRRNAWECLMQIVLSQQINLALAHGILAELTERFGRRARVAGRELYDFPSPETLAGASATDLRGLRASRAKAETLRRLGEAFATGTLSDERLRALPDDEAVALLTSFKGVGTWTAEFVLLRGLGRLDVFPAGDLGVVKYVAKELLGYRAPASEEDMRRFSERWRPYRGLALIYAYAELALRTTEAQPPPAGAPRQPPALGRKPRGREGRSTRGPRRWRA